MELVFGLLTATAVGAALILGMRSVGEDGEHHQTASQRFVNILGVNLNVV